MTDRGEAAGPRLETWFHETVSGRRRGLGATLSRLLLCVLAWFYTGGLFFRELIYTLRLIQPRRVPARVISVGNVTLGGTGKTPAVMYLANRFRDQGERVAVLIRGHGGERQGGINVVHDGARRRLGVEQVGDEAVLLAERLGDVPILAGKDRRLTAAAAVSRFEATVILLDDGFQYRRLAIDDHVVLLDATQPFGTGRLFPAGTLRDPPGYLQRADEIWITRVDHPEALPLERLQADLRHWAPGVPVHRCRHVPARLWRFPSGQVGELAQLRGRRVMGMAGIGNPGAFWATLWTMGIGSLVEEPFPDHHQYQQEEIAEVVRRATADNCELVVTTEKDAVRLELWPAGGPELWVLGIELVFVDGGLAKEAGEAPPAGN